MAIEKSSKILVGKTEICTFAGIGKDLFPDLIAKGFPAVCWGGKWRAHAENIEKWIQAATLPRGPQQDMEEIEN
ncbi:MAG: hypothetical protein ACOC1H_02025 [Desulfosalsimonas sp.]